MPSAAIEGETGAMEPFARGCAGAWTRSARRDERAIAMCEGVIDLAAALFNVSGKDLRRPGRCPLDVSRVRQIAMYAAHVCLGLSMKEVGRGFGRDRTTVLHACHLVEDLRDEPEFDQLVSMTERVVRAAFGRTSEEAGQ